MKHTIKEIAAKVEKFCIEWDQFDRSRPFKNWEKDDYCDTARNYKNILGYFSNIKENCKFVSVEKTDWHLLVNYGNGSAKIKIDLMMEEILLPEIDLIFPLFKSQLAA